MPWNETCPMIERRRFIERFLEGGHPITGLATEFGISRPTAYKWIARFQNYGWAGLLELSRAAKHHPNETPCLQTERILDLRRQRRTWGPKKLKWRLQRLNPELVWPAESTIGEILRRNGQTVPQPRRRRAAHRSQPLYTAKHPNEVWTMDFKGWFRVGSGERVDPLTVADVASRYLFACKAMRKTSWEAVQPEFEKLFREYGLPWLLRSDNGPPFASCGLGGLTPLAVWWIKLGIILERIRPAHPEENGGHERMHRTLKQEAAKPPQATWELQDLAHERFRRDYNEERPHEGIGMLPPAEVYVRSSRQYPEKLAAVEYGTDYTVRRVRHNGETKWRGRNVYLTQALRGESVGLLPLADGVWAIDFGSHRLGYYDARREKVLPSAPPAETQSVNHVPG